MSKEYLIDKAIRSVDARGLEVLLAVAEAGSFRKAGASLGLQQSTVSRRIQRLEDLIGVSLFERSPRGARLTGAGAAFVECARSIFDNLKSAIINAQSNGIAKSGLMRIGTTSSLSKGPPRELIRMFVERHPAVELQFVETGRRRLISMLQERTLDAGILIGKDWTEEGDGIVLNQSQMYLAVANGGPLSKSLSVSWSEIVDEVFLVSGGALGVQVRDYIIRQATDFGRGVSIKRHQVARDLLMNIVGLGLGITVVSEVATGVKYPGVTFIPIKDGESHVPYSLIWRPENDNPALRRFHISCAGRGEEERRSLLSFANPRSVFMNRSSIGATSLAGSSFCPFSAPSISA